MKTYFYKLITGLDLVAQLCSSYIKEQAMRYVHFEYVTNDEYRHLVDMYFKLEMKYVLDKIMFEYSRGSLDTICEHA